MKITVEKIYQIALSQAFQTLKDLPMHGLLYRSFQRALKEIDKIYQETEEVRNTLIKKYGELTEQGDYKVKEENTEDFFKDFKEVLSQEEEITAFKLPLSKLNLTPNQYTALEDFINIDE